MNNRKFLCLLAIALFANSCSKSEITTGSLTPANNNSIVHTLDQSINEISNPTLTITDESLIPIAGAKILIGLSLNNPNSGNFIQTDQFGKAIIPFEFSNQPITVSADGFLRITIFNQDSTSKSIKLKTADLQNRIEITGQTTGFGNLPNDGLADFGLVLSALSKRDLFSFNQNLIISPESDSFEVVGQTSKVPSNLTFPHQKESYFFPITLEKEQYRMYFSNPGKKTVVALHGQFPFKKVVDAIRGGQKMSTLINDFSIKSVGITDSEFRSNTNLNLPVDHISFTRSTPVTAPAVGPESTFLVIPAMRHLNSYIPTDIKNLNEGDSTVIKSPNDGELFVLGVVQKKSQFRGADHSMTLSINPLANGIPTSRLGTFEINTFNSQGWNSTFPTNPNQIQETATYSVLSSIQTVGNVPIRTRKWEVITQGWINQLALPQWPDSSEFNIFTDVGTPQRWEVSFLGNQALETFDFDSDLIDSVSHVSYNSKDF